jgi:hypothetical protein
VGWQVSDDSRVVRSREKIVGDREDDGHDDTWQDSPLLRAAAFEGMAENTKRPVTERLELALQTVRYLREHVDVLRGISAAEAESSVRLDREGDGQTIDVGPPGEVTIEYGVFNDSAVWEPIFAAGEVHESLREVVLDRPLYASEVLEEVARHARLANEERALDVAKVDKFGYVVVRTRRVVRSPWADVPLDEQARALGEF